MMCNSKTKDATRNRIVFSNGSNPSRARDLFCRFFRGGEMGGVSAGWLAAVQTGQSDDWHPAEGPAGLLTPWIAPRVPRRLLDLITRLGSSRRLEAGEYIYAPHEPVDRLVVVRNGLTARAVVDPASSQPEAIAISPPGRLGSGNLNFFSGRPCAGRYFALCRSEIVSCPQSLIRAMGKADPELGWLIVHYFELCNLSDRLGFASQVMLPVPTRLKTLFLSWAVSFGHEAERIDAPGRWIRMPALMSRGDMARVIHASLMSVDRLLGEWRQGGLILREGAAVWVRPELLRDAHAWLCRTEEDASLHPRPRELSDALQPRA